MSAFKVGDKVEVVDPVAPLYRGAIVTVRSVLGVDADMVTLNEKPGLYMRNRFKRVRVEPDIENLRQDVIDAVMAWNATVQDLAEDESLTSEAEAIFNAAEALKAAEKPEREYRVYSNAVFSSGVIEREMGADDLQRYTRGLDIERFRVHPIDPETGLAGAELSPEELKALLGIA